MDIAQLALIKVTVMRRGARRRREAAARSGPRPARPQGRESPAREPGCALGPGSCDKSGAGISLRNIVRFSLWTACFIRRLPLRKDSIVASESADQRKGPLPARSARLAASMATLRISVCELPASASALAERRPRNSASLVGIA